MIGPLKKFKEKYEKFFKKKSNKIDLKLNSKETNLKSNSKENDLKLISKDTQDEDNKSANPIKDNNEINEISHINDIKDLNNNINIINKNNANLNNIKNNNLNQDLQKNPIIKIQTNQPNKENIDIDERTNFNKIKEEKNSNKDNNINEEIFNIYFRFQGSQINIRINGNSTVEELFKKFSLKTGILISLIGEEYKFLYKSYLLDVKSQEKINKKFTNGDFIIVAIMENVIG